MMPDSLHLVSIVPQRISFGYFPMLYWSGGAILTICQSCKVRQHPRLRVGHVYDARAIICRNFLGSLAPAYSDIDSTMVFFGIAASDILIYSAYNSPHNGKEGKGCEYALDVTVILANIFATESTIRI